MKIAAIICEYNPLHNGHEHQIQETKLQTGCDAVLCIMSGNFTQRAEASIMQKYERARIATLCGADVVVGLPTAFCTNNAEVFALAGVKVANAFKAVKWLSFGMEQPNLGALEEAADFFLSEPDIYKQKLKQFLSLGLSFSESRIRAVEELIQNDLVRFKNADAILKLLTLPNNILALEYVKALRQTNSTIQPVLIKRVGSGYNEQALQGTFSSATAIRTKLLQSGTLDEAAVALPAPSFTALKNYITKNGIMSQSKLHYLAFYKFRTSPSHSLKKLYNMGEGLENYLQKEALGAENEADFVENIKTRRYKTSRLNSILLNGVLSIEKSTVSHIYKVQKFPYLKVLAINHNNKNLLSHLSCTSKLILRKNDITNLKKTKFTKELMQIEDRANTVYNLLAGKNLLAVSDIHTNIFKK